MNVHKVFMYFRRFIAKQKNRSLEIRSRLFVRPTGLVKTCAWIIILRYTRYEVPNYDEDETSPENDDDGDNSCAGFPRCAIRFHLKQTGPTAKPKA